MDESIKKYYSWQEEEFKKVINVKQLYVKAEELKLAWLQEAPFDPRWSSIWRHEVLSTLKYYVIPKKTEYICTWFRITRSGLTSYRAIKNVQFHTIYAFMYSYDDPIKGLQHEFACACPTFISADGEYRHRFLSIRQYLDMRKAHASLLDKVEDHFVQQLVTKQVSISTETIYPQYLESKKSQLHKQLISFIDKYRLTILFYIVNWLTDYIKYTYKTLENHIIKGYTEAMFSSQDEDFYKTIREQANTPDDSTTRDFARFYKTQKSSGIPYLEVGQKIIPITVKQLEEIDSIQHDIWAEMRISSLVGDLVINGISPSFPIFDAWFLIQGAKTSMYDNQIMSFKMNNSAIASEIVRKLENDRRGTYMLDPIKKNEIYLSYNMEGLSETIEIAMDYAEESMIMAKTTLCSLVEHVGRTMVDQPILMQDKEHSRYNGPLFESHLWFAKYIFEYLYGIYMMNSKLNLIHGDLHLNNVTIFMKRGLVNVITENTHVPNPHIIYDMDNTLYIFPHYGRFSCIIDFSRSIIGSQFPLEKLDMQYAIATDQRRKILRTFEKEFPEFYQEHHQSIQAALLSNYDTVFRAFSAVDAYKLASGMIHMLTTRKEIKSAETPNLIKFLTGIQQSAFHYLTVVMLQIFARQTSVEKIGWPLAHIITDHFAQYTIDKFVPLGKITIIDYYSSSNTMRYNIRDYDNFPPNVKLDYVVEHKIPIEQIGLANYHDYQEYIRVRNEDERVAEIQEAERATKSERRGSPELSKTAPSKEKIKDFKKELETINDFYYSS